jgi:hypothetical protein
MLNKFSPVPHKAERKIAIRKRRNDGIETLTSSPFVISLEEIRQANIEKADQQRKRKETRGKNFLNKPQKTKSHNTSKRRLQTRAEVGSEVDRPKEIECIICGESFD